MNRIVRKIYFLPHESYNEAEKVRYAASFSRPSIQFSETKYIRRGELVTRLLHVNTNSQTGINDFLIFCGISTTKNEVDYKRWSDTISCEQSEIVKMIEYYINVKQNSSLLYSFKTLSIRLDYKIKDIKTNIISVPNIQITPTIKLKKRTVKADKYRKKTIQEKNYVLVNEYESENIFSLVWIELIECFKQDIIPKKCECGSYYFHYHNKNCNQCFMCPLPSRESASIRKTKNPAIYEETRLKNNIITYVKRNTGSKEKIKKYFESKGIKEHPDKWIEKNIRKYKKEGEK